MSSGQPTPRSTTAGSEALRGQIVDVEAGAASNVGALILSNDVWNRKMAGLAAIPVRARSAVPVHGVPLGTLGWADPHWLSTLPVGRLGRPTHVVAQAELDAIEDALVDIMALADVCVSDPMPPLSPAGAITYPRWGDIYWIPALAAETGQTKRYVVVSHDHYNSAGNRPFVVRTTSQEKRNTQDFPVIEGGACHACCGEVLSQPTKNIQMRPRPAPESLSIGDMAAIGWGIASVLELEAAVARAT